MMTSALLISNLLNIRYLSGVELSFGMMIVTPRGKKLFVDGRYTEKAKSQAREEIIVLPIQELDGHLQRFGNIRFEGDDVTVNRLQRWKKRFKGTKLIPSSGVMEELRREKRAEEITAVRQACKITDAILRDLPRHLRPGMTEREVAWHIREQAHEKKAEDLAFDTIVAFGPHTSRPHHSPTHRTLKKSDIVQIDMGVKVNGYCSDCSRVFKIGDFTSEEQEVFDLLCSVVRSCTKMAKPGITNHALDKHARNMLGDFAQHFPHGLGHGVGLEIHEGASLSSRAEKQRLKENEVITIEPGIYMQGKWGMRIEDTILVTGKGGKQLTRVDYSL